MTCQTAEATLARTSRNGIGPLIGALDCISELRMETYRVVGKYVRFAETGRVKLIDFSERILACFQSGVNRNAFIVGGKSGEGKSSLFYELARAHPEIKFVNLNLGAQSFQSDLRLLDQPSNDPTLVLIDEINSRKNETWPYETLLPYFDQPPVGRAFVLVGSSSTGVSGVVSEIVSRPKGPDLVNRIRLDRRFSVPSMTPGDQAVIFAAAVQEAANRRQMHIAMIEKWAMLYVVASGEVTNGHQIRDLATAAVDRMSRGGSLLRFSHLFDLGDEQLFAFRSRHQGPAKCLDGRWIRLSD